MNPILWNPIREFEELMGRWNRKHGTHENSITLPDWTPSVNIAQTKDNYRLTVDLPGVEKKDVSVTIRDGVLVVEGVKNAEESISDVTMHRTESPTGRFIRSFSLPEEVSADKMTAVYKDGVLTLTIPKQEQVKPRSIEIAVQ
jgi:HSP20 family protein